MSVLSINLTNFYNRPPTNFREGNVFTSVCLFTGVEGGEVPPPETYVSLRLRVQNAVPAQPCVGKLGISLVLLNFLHCNFRLWFKTP